MSIVSKKLIQPTQKAAHAEKQRYVGDKIDGTTEVQ
jgi:hypothetical protein